MADLLSGPLGLEGLLDTALVDDARAGSRLDGTLLVAAALEAGTAAVLAGSLGDAAALNNS